MPTGRSPRPEATPAPLIDAVGTLAFVAGATLIHAFARLPPMSSRTLLCIAGIVLVLLRCRASRVVGWAALGAALAAFAGADALAARWPVARDGEDLRATVVVTGLPERFDRGWRFDAIVTPLADATPAPTRWRARLAWFDPTATVTTGLRLEATVRMRTPRGTRNPGAFDFERHAIERGIDATGYLRQARVRDAAAVDAAPAATTDRLRARISTAITTALGDTRAAALVRALAIGEQAAIDDADWQAVRATGLTHLIAISGFHVAMVALLGALACGAIMRLAPTLCLRWPRRQAMRAAALVVACGYGAIAGGAIPVVRTVAMIAIVSAIGWCHRRVPTAAVLAAAVTAIIAVEPLATLGAGFWLSCAGVAWLVHGLTGRSHAGGWRTYLHAQGVATIGLAALGIAWFQQVSLVGPLLNLVAIPWFSLVLVPLSLLAATFAAAALPGASTLLDLAARFGEWTWQAAHAIAALPGVDAPWPAPTWPVTLLALAGAAIVLLPRAVPGRALGIVLLLPLAWPRSTAPPPGEFAVDVIDVGQGLSVLVRTHAHAVLYDAGPAAPDRIDQGDAAVVPTLVARGNVRPDRLVVSHADNDHAGGLGAVRRYHAAPVIAGPDVDAADATTCDDAMRWRHDGVTFAILHPPAHFPALGNDSSCVLRVDNGRASLLIAGDIAMPVEQRLVDRGANLRADVLVIPHHGSRGSSSPAFVAAVSPRVAIASSGWHNRFGHPAPDVVARYVAAGADVIDTGEAGLVALATVPGGGWRIARERDVAARWWQSR